MSDELKEFIIDTIYRCGYTLAEVMLGFITVGAAIKDVPWKVALSVSVVAVLGCLLKQLFVYCKEHVNPKYDPALLAKMDIPEPEDSYSAAEFTAEEIAAYREKEGDADV